MFNTTTTTNSNANSSTWRRKICVLWLAMLGLVALALPFGSGCDETQVREALSAAQQAAEDLDPWTKFCLINSSAEDFAACEAGTVE